MSLEPWFRSPCGRTLTRTKTRDQYLEWVISPASGRATTTNNQRSVCMPLSQPPHKRLAGHVSVDSSANDSGRRIKRNPRSWDAETEPHQDVFDEDDFGWGGAGVSKKLQGVGSQHELILGPLQSALHLRAKQQIAQTYADMARVKRGRQRTPRCARTIQLSHQ